MQECVWVAGTSVARLCGEGLGWLSRAGGKSPALEEIYFADQEIACGEPL